MNWLARVWERRKLEQDLAKELQFHIAERITAFKNMGLSEEEAGRQVRQEFGGIEQVKEVCRDARGTRWFEDFWQDVRYAVRMWCHRPGFAVIALATLALGSGATTIMFTVINGVLLKPLSYPEPDRLFTLRENTQEYRSPYFAYFDFLDCRHEGRTMNVAAWKYDGGGMITKPGKPEYLSGREISSNLFSVLGARLLREPDRRLVPPAQRLCGFPARHSRSCC
jgi:putative ABC transport system permease protein